MCVWRGWKVGALSVKLMYLCKYLLHELQHMWSVDSDGRWGWQVLYCITQRIAFCTEHADSLLWERIELWWVLVLWAWLRWSAVSPGCQSKVLYFWCTFEMHVCFTFAKGIGVTQMHCLLFSKSFYLFSSETQFLTALSSWKLYMIIFTQED